jgi:hypothetical protein
MRSNAIRNLQNNRSDSTNEFREIDTILRIFD